MELTPRPDDVYFTAERGFLTSMKVISGFSSSLSLIGVIVIIISQVAFPSLWPCKCRSYTDDRSNCMHVGPFN